MTELEISAMTFGPYGVGHRDGKAVMVAHSVVGDRLEVAPFSERRDYSVAKIREIIRGKGLTQTEAAKILSLTQPKLSGILRGEFRSISERKLIGYLTSLGHDVFTQD